MNNMNSLAERIIVELDGRRNGNNIRCRCPVRDHKSGASALSVTIKGNILLVKCHAGCEQSEVIAAMKSLNLWPQNQRRRRHAKRNNGDGHAHQQRRYLTHIEAVNVAHGYLPNGELDNSVFLEIEKMRDELTIQFEADHWVDNQVELWQELDRERESVLP